MRQEKISKKHGKLLWIAKICYSIWLKLTATQALYITFDPSLILAGFFFAWLSWSNNNGTNLFKIWILYAGNYYKPVFRIKSWLFLAILRKLEKNFPTLPSFVSFIVAIFAKLMLLFGCFKRTKLIGKLSTWGEPLDQSVSSY